MHLIVKKEATMPAAKKLHKQQEHFDASCTSTTRSACISDCHEVSSRALRELPPHYKDISAAVTAGITALRTP
jgi:hypothetical protein